MERKKKGSLILGTGPRSVLVEPATLLAPMESVTDLLLRRAIRRLGGCGLTVTEFVAATHLARGDRRAQKIAAIDADEHPVAVQIFGRNPELMAKGARQAVAMGADLVDINMGCPSKKVTEGAAGAALMQSPELARAIVAEVRAAIDVPLTVKMRLGWAPGEANAAELAALLWREGCDGFAVHGRFRTQFYGGEADWAAVKEVVDAVPVPVVVNGDIHTAAQAMKALQVSTAQGVMVGRGALRDPFVFRAIAASMVNKEVAPPRLAERRDFLLQLLEEVAIEAEHPLAAIGRTKQMVSFLTRGLKGGRALREAVFRCDKQAQALPAIKAFFAQAEMATEDPFALLVDDEEDHRLKANDARGFRLRED